MAHKKLFISIPKLPRINPHGTALEQDAQLKRQLKWLKENGFKNVREAQEAGY